MQTRTSTRRAVVALLIGAAVPAAVHAQQSSRPPLRPLGRALATSDAMGAVVAVHPLPGGRLLVNDPMKRQVVLLDSSLKQLAVVADTTAATRNAYGARNGGLIPFRGDSALFVDPTSLSMLVIDPAGKIARVMAAPRANDVMSLLGGPMGNPGFDAKGRLVYRSMALPDRRPSLPVAGQPFTPPLFPDTVPIVRYDLAARKLDTAAFVKVYAPKWNVLQREGGGFSMQTISNPMPEVDDWAVLHDGTIAIVRKDYHVDFVDADGKRTSAPRIPFDWQRLTDSAKSAVIDSAKAASERMRAGGPGAGSAGGQMIIAQAGPGGPPPGAGAGPMIMIRERGAEGAAPPSRAAAPSGAVAGPSPQAFVSPSELPDYRPAFANGSVRADAEGKLWVRIMSPKPASGPEYDVIDRTGKLVDRVVLPAGTTIVGFGPGGTVYLGVRDASGVHVVRAREK
ncbi:MAG TPA: hypothetical protein VFS59_01710 [Gemmatimonadaceae bacterium]|nr:hypothetical protein [Gemmatimonadaceae bacterium]